LCKYTISNGSHALGIFPPPRRPSASIAAGYEDCNDADHLRIDPALRLVIGKGHKARASQSLLSRLENSVLGNESGLDGLDNALRRSTDALLRKKDRRRLIIDVDSTVLVQRIFGSPSLQERLESHAFIILS
jgi:hypothetical protein